MSARLVTSIIRADLRQRGEMFCAMRSLLCTFALLEHWEYTVYPKIGHCKCKRVTLSFGTELKASVT